MPIPEPNKGEQRADFMNRCMSDGVMTREYQDIEQRAAICSRQFRKSVNGSDLSDIKTVSLHQMH